MKQKYTIELVEEYDNVNFYSIHLEGEELTEMEAFFEKFPVGCVYDDEIDVIISSNCHFEFLLQNYKFYFEKR